MSAAPSALLVMGVLFRERVFWEKAASQLEDLFGPLGPEDLEFPFDRTDYYAEEMGAGLKRVFVSFRDPVSQDGLAEIKERSLWLEDVLADTAGEGKHRRVNLDPGLLDLDRLVLATAKNFSHRVCLKGGIFAEVELIFRDGRFHPLPWTYPDYRRRDTLAFFHALRVHWHRRQQGKEDHGSKG
jgi:hypothetical protein